MAENYGGTGAWFEQDEPGKQLDAAVEELRLKDNRASRFEKFFQLYGGSRLHGIRPWETPDDFDAADVLTETGDRLRLNVVKAALDTITAKVGKLRPRPTFLTTGGDWSLQLKAKKLQRFMDGAYHQADAYEIGPDVFRDAMLFGTGVFHPYREGKRLRTERVPLWELFVDPADAMYGTPRCLYRIKWMSREAACAAHGFKAAAAEFDPDTYSRDSEATRAGLVRCIEAWCLPTDRTEDCDPRPADGWKPSPGKYGRRTLIVGGKCVVDEDYPIHEFPFVFVHWTKPVQGFWGLSAVQEVVGLQVEINQLIQLIQKSMRKVGQPTVFTREGVILTPLELTNDVAEHVEVSGDFASSLSEAMYVATFQPINPQIMSHLWALYGKAFEILGSNQLAASATAPVGLESGRALEALAEEHSERFMTVSRHFENAIGSALARQFIRLAKEIDRTEKGGFKIQSPGSRSTLHLKWKDVAMDEDAYLIQVFPTSVLPTTPAARLKEVERLAAAGWIDPSEARRLLDFPDLRQSTDLAVADTENLLRQLEVMLEDGKQVTPEPYQDLTKARRWATASILRAQADGVPDKHIRKVRNFVTACDALEQRAVEQAKAQAALVAPVAPPTPGGGLPAPSPMPEQQLAA